MFLRIEGIEGDIHLYTGELEFMEIIEFCKDHFRGVRDSDIEPQELSLEFTVNSSAHRQEDGSVGENVQRAQSQEELNAVLRQIQRGRQKFKIIKCRLLVEANRSLEYENVADDSFQFEALQSDSEDGQSVKNTQDQLEDEQNSQIGEAPGREDEDEDSNNHVVDGLQQNYFIPISRDSQFADSPQTSAITSAITSEQNLDWEQSVILKGADGVQYEDFQDDDSRISNHLPAEALQWGLARFPVWQAEKQSAHAVSSVNQSRSRSVLSESLQSEAIGDRVFDKLNAPEVDEKSKLRSLIRQIVKSSASEINQAIENIVLSKLEEVFHA